MATEPITIQKDADLVIPHLYEGDESLTGATITWALLPWKPSWEKDLETLISDEALFAAKTVGAALASQSWTPSTSR